jgi:iron complex outermembrane receptor protein
MCRFKIGVLSVAMSIVLLATPAAAAAQSVGGAPVPSVDTTLLDAVHVTARQTSAAGAVLQSVSQTRFLVDQKERAPLGTAEAVLRLVPSVDIRERGGKSTQADIAIRGGSFDQTMMMLNGIDFSDARTGHQSISLPVDIDLLSDIAILDGVAYPGALAGAVDFQTEPLFPRYLRARLEGGAWGYGYGNLSGAWTSDDGRLRAIGAASLRRSDGYRHNTDFWNVNAFSRVVYTARRAGTFDVQGGFQRREWGSNGFYSLKYPEQFESTRTGLASVRWSKSWRRLSLEAMGSFRLNDDLFEMVRDNPDSAAGGIPFNYHTTYASAAGLNAGYAWGEAGTSSLGVNLTRHTMFSTAMGHAIDNPRHDIWGLDGDKYPKSVSRDIASAWAGHRKDWSRGWIGAQGTFTHTPYGADGTFAAEAGWRPGKVVSLRASALRSMRLPTFTDLFYNVAIYHPNPNLKPETAMTYRLTARAEKGAWSGEGSLWYRRTRDVIDWEQRTGDREGDIAGHWYSTQLNRLGTIGGELTARYNGSSEGWLRGAMVSYGYLNSDMSVATDYISKYALDYMRHKLSAVMSVGFLRDFVLTLTGSVYDRVGSYVAVDDSVQGYSPYFLLDGRLSWEPRGVLSGGGGASSRGGSSRGGGVQIYIDATNITGTDYFDFGGLPMPKTWLSAGVSVTIR